MMGPWFNWGFGGFAWIMPVLMIVFWGLVIWGIVWLVRGGNRHVYSHTDRPESAMEILKRRYASGEISREEFEERKRDIG